MNLLDALKKPIIGHVLACKELINDVTVPKKFEKKHKNCKTELEIQDLATIQNPNSSQNQIEPSTCGSASSRVETQELYQKYKKIIIIF
ncbi:hypothetical protein ACJX0J_024131, partial [Zea mays]